MAKGDYIEVQTVAGGLSRSVTIEATKAGRRVSQRTISKNRAQWIEVTELTRTNRPVGHKVLVRMEVVVAVHEVMNEDGDLWAKAKAGVKVARGQTSLPLAEPVG